MLGDECRESCIEGRPSKSRSKIVNGGPLGVQTARGELLSGAMSEGVIREVHGRGQQELDARLLGIRIQLQCCCHRFLALFVQLG